MRALSANDRPTASQAVLVATATNRPQVRSRDRETYKRTATIQKSVKINRKPKQLRFKYICLIV